MAPFLEAWTYPNAKNVHSWVSQFDWPSPLIEGGCYLTPITSSRRHIAGLFFPSNRTFIRNLLTFIFVLLVHLRRFSSNRRSNKSSSFIETFGIPSHSSNFSSVNKLFIFQTQHKNKNLSILDSISEFFWIRVGSIVCFWVLKFF